MSSSITIRIKVNGGFLVVEQGKETYELHVDYPLKRIVVDENGDKLYGIALNNGEFAIVEFNLKQKSKL